MASRLRGKRDKNPVLKFDFAAAVIGKVERPPSASGTTTRAQLPQTTASGHFIN
jgi:hypothetical protein